MRILLFVLYLLITSCKAQERIHIVDNEFYIKSHKLLDDILNKGKSTYCLKKTFDFNNQQNLTVIKLFGEITYFHPLSFKESRGLNDAIKDIARFKDSTGWLAPSSNDNSLKEWKLSLFEKSKIVVVDSLKKEFIYTENGVTYFNIIPLQINFKDDLAMVLYKGPFGLELYAYRFADGKWGAIGVARQYKGSKE